MNTRKEFALEKEQIAHDLTMVYLSNQYSAEVVARIEPDTTGSSVTSIATKRFPKVDEVQFKKVGTGEKTLFGLIEKTQKVEDGFKVDSIFVSMLDDYLKTYSKFLELLNSR